MEDQDKRIQEIPKTFRQRMPRRAQRASLFAYHTGYTVHFQSIDEEDLREGHVCMGHAFSWGREHCGPEGNSLRSGRNHILYIHIATIGWGECQSDMCLPVWEVL